MGGWMFGESDRERIESAEKRAKNGGKPVCTGCGGTGYYDGHKCWRCGGSGNHY